MDKNKPVKKKTHPIISSKKNDSPPFMLMKFLSFFVQNLILFTIFCTRVSIPIWVLLALNSSASWAKLNPTSSPQPSTTNRTQKNHDLKETKLHTPSLDELDLFLKEVLPKNPKWQSSYGEYKVSEYQATLQSSLMNPKLGYMKEELTQTMQSWSISQEFLFPTKYFQIKNQQDALTKKFYWKWKEQAWDLRKEVIKSLVNYEIQLKTRELLEAKKNTLLEISRTVEVRRSTGKFMQQDEMKVHIEQTQTENELLLQSQEQEEALQALIEVVGKENLNINQLPLLPIEKIKLSEVQTSTSDIYTAPSLKVKQMEYQQSVEEKTLAHSSWWPDMMISYRRPFEKMEAKGDTFEISLTLPLYFFSKQIPEVKKASQEVLNRQNELEGSERTWRSKLASLSKKQLVLKKLMTIYETSLLPQSSSLWNTSRSYYETGRGSFLELLEAERNYYEKKLKYLQIGADLISVIAEQESLMGQTFSNLPVGFE